MSNHGAAIAIPTALAEEFLAKKIKRVICLFKNGRQLHGAIHHRDSFYYLMLGKQMAKDFHVIPGEEITVALEEDTTLYQIGVCEEFLEVVQTDPEGADLFHQLTPGKQRGLIHAITMKKSSNLRIEKSLLLLKNLKAGITDLPKLLKVNF